MSTLTFTGLNAFWVARDANLLPEVLDTTTQSWRLARSIAEARRLVGIDPSLLRLKADDRILCEHLTGKALDLGQDVKSYMMAQPAPPAESGAAAVLACLENT